MTTIKLYELLQGDSILSYNGLLLYNIINDIMPANKRPRRLNYAVNKKGPKTGGKVGKAVAHYKKLQDRIQFEGETKWLINAVKIITAKLNKYKINLNKI